MQRTTLASTANILIGPITDIVFQLNITCFKTGLLGLNRIFLKTKTKTKRDVCNSPFQINELLFGRVNLKMER